jgi:hypothetical protein
MEAIVTPDVKNWKVKFFHEKKVLEMQVPAERSIDARRLVKTKYLTCSVLSVTPMAN